MSLGPIAILLVALGLESPASARPEAPEVFCSAYADAGACAGRLLSCSTCHTTTWPPTWNEYGLQLMESMVELDGEYADVLLAAIEATGELDMDGDGAGNLDELLARTDPGDPLRAPLVCEPRLVDERGLPLDDRYDFSRAYRRVHVLYCGQLPSFDELRRFEGDNPSPPERYHALHEALDRCLASAYWQDEGLPRIADRLIKPISTFGADSKTGNESADYWWDYRLFSYIMTHDRDVRDLLLADYHVERADHGALVPIEGVIEGTLGSGYGFDVGGQPVQAPYRAGMITTQWFLAANTLIAPLPRITAAQAYRAYLGYDIALQQGLMPVAGEPVDVDAKGVAEPECALCHSTLDPLAYAFAEYAGLGFGGQITGGYYPERPRELIPGWDDNPSSLLGEPVGSVVEWAQRAVQTDAFKHNIATMMFRYIYEREPTVDERGRFDEVWRALPEHGWSANYLIHRWIELPAFGA